jgi:competence protein ComEC
MKAEGISTIDTIMISHGDADHQGGLEAVLTAFDVKRVMSSEPERLPMIAHNTTKVTHCGSMEDWIWEGVFFEVKAPKVEGHKGHKGHKANDKSCILKITHPIMRSILVGDLGKQAFEQLYEDYGPQWLKTDLIMVPHHGSKHSLVPSTIHAMKAAYTVISVGAYNTYGHPAPEVINAYGVYGPVFETAIHGLIKFDIKHNKLEISHSRRDQWPMWSVPNRARWCHGAASAKM